MEKRWWAARDADGYCRLIRGDEPLANAVGEWASGGKHKLVQGSFADLDSENISQLACRDVGVGQCRELIRFDPIAGVVEYAPEPQSLLEAAINWRLACWTEQDIRNYRASRLSTMQYAVALVDAIDREMAKSQQPQSVDPFGTGPNGSVDPRRVEHPQLGS